jgi:hypothetical protein
MWLWSKGLGRVVLPMDFDEAEVEVEDGRLVFKGWIVAPKVYWDYWLSLEEKDVLDSMGLMANRDVVRHLARTGGLGFLALLVRRSVVFGLAFLRAELVKTLGSGARAP